MCTIKINYSDGNTSSHSKFNPFRFRVKTGWSNCILNPMIGHGMTKGCGHDQNALYHLFLLIRSTRKKLTWLRLVVART